MARSTKDEMNYTDRRQQVSELYLEGWRQTELADKFGVTQATISRDLSAIRKQWVESTILNFDEAMARELERIDKLERTYWEAWEHSKEDAETLTQKGKADGRQVKPVEAIKVSKGQSGNPSFLAGIQWCIEQRLKIFGVYEVAKWKAYGDWRKSAKELGVPLDQADMVFEQDVNAMLSLMTGDAGADGR